MSSSLAELTGKNSVTLSLKNELTGETREFTMRPLTLGQWSMLEEWLKKQPFERAKEYARLVPPDNADAVFNKAYDHSRSIFLGSEEFNAALRSFTATREVFGLSISHEHPKTKQEEWEQYIGMSDVPAIQDAFTRLNIKKQEGEASDEPKKTKSR